MLEGLMPETLMERLSSKYPKQPEHEVRVEVKIRPVHPLHIPREVASLITAMWNNVEEYERQQIIQEVEKLKGEPEAKIAWLAARAVQKLLAVS